MTKLLSLFESPIFGYATLIIFIGVFATIIWAFVYWWKKSHYTRERFAFMGAIALLGLVTLFIFNLTNGVSLTVVALNVAASLLRTFRLENVVTIPQSALAPIQLTPIEAVLFAGIVFWLGNWYYRVFMGWDGQKSIAQHEQEVNSEKPKLGSDISLMLSLNTRTRQRLNPHRPTNETEQPWLENVTDTRAWHESARIMWSARNRRHHFDGAFDARYKCWWGQDKNTETGISLVCCQTTPTMQELEQLVEYCLQTTAYQRAGRLNIIVAYKFGEANEKARQICNIEIHWISEMELLRDLIDFSDYFSELDFRLNQETLPDSPLSLSQIYSRSIIRVSSDDADPTRYDTEEFLHEWLAENSNRHIALLGEYGQGKSTISLMFSYGLVRRLREGKSERIPILMELRGKSPRSLTPEELLATWAYKYRIDVQSLFQLLVAGRLLLIFEGFDEMDLTGDTDSRLNHFRTLWRLAYPEAKILITGRPNFFLDNSERKRALGVGEPNQNRPYCQAVLLAPFDVAHIRDSLRHTDSQTRDEICSLAGKDRKFLEIVSRPSLLFIVSMLWKRENLSEKIEIISSALVMELFITHSYRRQGAKEAERNFMALNTSERAYFMRGIAGYMAPRLLPNQISLSQLNIAIELLVEAIPDDVSRAAGALADETRQPLRSSPERFDWQHSRADVLDHIKTDVRACGILVSDVSKDGHFKFAHKSFMEFLQGQLVYQLFSNDPVTQLAATSIVNKIGIDVGFLDYSPEAMKFLAELVLDESALNNKQTSSLIVINRLFDIIVIGEWRGSKAKMIFKKFIVRLYLAISNMPFVVVTGGRSNFSMLMTVIAMFSILGLFVVFVSGIRIGDHAISMNFFRLFNSVAIPVTIVSMLFPFLLQMCRGIHERSASFVGICAAHRIPNTVVEGILGKTLVRKLATLTAASDG